MKGNSVVTGAVFAALVAFTASMTAQQGGRERSLTGCLARNAETPKKDMHGNASRDVNYKLTNVEGGVSQAVEIAQSPKSLPLYTNHKIQITGTPVTGPDKSVLYMRVTGIRSLNNTCP